MCGAYVHCSAPGIHETDTVAGIVGGITGIADIPRRSHHVI